MSRALNDCVIVMRADDGESLGILSRFSLHRKPRRMKREPLFFLFFAERGCLSGRQTTEKKKKNAARNARASMHSRLRNANGGEGEAQ